MNRGFIDLYGYDKNAYDNLTMDFVRCLKEYNPTIDQTIRTHQNWVRLERKVWVDLHPIDELEIEGMMRSWGYTRYKDYNFYVCSSLLGLK